jgi:hypothetical protein
MRIERGNMREVFYEDIKSRAQEIYEQYKYLMKEVLKRDPNSLDSQLKLYLKDDMNLGGKAWSKNNIDNIQINKGVIDNFFDYFYDFTKKRSEDFLNMLPFLVEDIESEEVSYEGIVYDNNGKAKVIDSKVIDLNLASLLNIFVARFIVTHELGHLFNGHCRYLNSKDGGSVKYIPIFYNDIDENISIISALDWRTLEMDADAFAVTDNFRNLVVLYSLFEEKVDSRLNIQPIDLFYWWSFAIRSNFLLMQNILNDNEYKENMTHLPSVARWNLIINSIDGILNSGMYKIKYRTGDSREKIMKTIIDGSMYAEKYFNEKFFTEYSWITEISKNTDYYEYITEINRNWKNIGSKLRCFSRLPLYNS